MQDLTHSLDRLTGQRLLVVGDLMLDRYVWGEAERVSPEAPVLVLTEDQDEVRPGGAANVASFLRALDAQVVLAGVVGDDTAGRTLLRLMQEIAVDTSLVVTDPTRPTTSKQRSSVVPLSGNPTRSCASTGNPAGRSLRNWNSG